MRKILSIALLLSVFACTVACSGQKDFINKSDNDLPEWFNSPDELSGVGVASVSRGGIKYQIAIAELDAKGNLATKIYTEISRVTKDALRSADVNKNSDVEEFFSQATKEVVSNMPFAGVTRDKTYIAKDGTLYVRVTMKPSEFNKSLRDSEKSMLATLKAKHLARESINKSEEATKAIFDELEKESR